jgi:hypothetical protein
MGDPARDDGRPAAIGVAAIVFGSALAAAELGVPNDLFWHLAIARRIAEAGFPRVDPFAFSTLTESGAPIDWSPPEWLGELAFGGAFALSGFAGTAALTLLAVVLLYVCLYRACRSAGASPLVAALAIVAVALPAAVHLPMRPLVLGHLLTAALLERLFALRAGDRRGLWLVPLAFALWSNVHPSWPMGLAILELHVLLLALAPALVRRAGLVVEALDPLARRALLVVGAASPLAVLLRPDGLDGALYPFVHVIGLGDRMTELIEWFPPDLAEPVNVVLVLLLAGALGLGLLRPKDVRALDVALVLVGAYLALRHQRFLPLAAMLAAPVLARGLSRTRLSDVRPSRVVSAGALVAACALFVAALPADLGADLEERYPVGAVRYLRGHDVGARAFNSFEDGGYLLFALPDRPVFIDSRFDLYARGRAFDDYLALRRGERIAEIFDTYGIDAALVPTEARDENFAALERALPALGFTIAHEDAATRVWVTDETAETRAIPSRSP